MDEVEALRHLQHGGTTLLHVLKGQPLYMDLVFVGVFHAVTTEVSIVEAAHDPKRLILHCIAVVIIGPTVEVVVRVRSSITITVLT